MLVRQQTTFKQDFVIAVELRKHDGCGEVEKNLFSISFDFRIQCTCTGTLSTVQILYYHNFK